VGRRSRSLFDDRVNYRTNSLPKSSPNVITLNTLVQGSKAIVDALAETQNTTSAEFLSDHGRAVTEVADVWEEIIESFEPHWAEVLENQPGAAGELRERYVFPHGLGWVALARAAATLIREHGDQWATHFRAAVRALDWERTAEVWNGNAVIHDRTKDTNRVNNTGPAITQMAELIAPKARAATISQ
jgi:DNA-sulfur modification-associated